MEKYRSAHPTSTRQYCVYRRGFTFHDRPRARFLDLAEISISLTTWRRPPNWRSSGTPDIDAIRYRIADPDRAICDGKGAFGELLRTLLDRPKPIFPDRFNNAARLTWRQRGRINRPPWAREKAKIR